MEPSCYLYSIRSHGWFTKSSTYSSDVKDAKQFSLEEAKLMCKKHIDQGAHKMIPVRVDDLL